VKYMQGPQFFVEASRRMWRILEGAGKIVTWVIFSEGDPIDSRKVKLSDVPRPFKVGAS